MQFTEESVRQLLDLTITPKYKDIIVDYRITVRQKDGYSTGVSIDVIVDPEGYAKHDDGYGWSNTLELEIEGSIRKIMKYLQPTFTMVDFYVVDDTQK